MSRRARGPREDGATRLRPRDHPPRPQMCIISDACSSGPGPKTSKVGEPARRHSSSRTGARRPVSLRCPRASPQSSGRVWARGPEPRSFSRLDDWGRLFQVQVLKIRVPDVGFKPFAPQGEAPGFVFPHDGGWWPQVEFIMSLYPSLSCLLRWGPLSSSPCVSLSKLLVVPPTPPRGSWSMCSCKFDVCVGGGEVRIRLPCLAS